MRTVAIADLLALSPDIALAASVRLDDPNAPYKRECAVLDGMSCCH